MSSKKQRYGNNRSNTTPTSNVKTLEEMETVETVNTETESETPITVGTTYTHEETTKETEEVIVPESNEVVFSNPVVDLEQEQQDLHQSRVNAILTESEVMEKVGLTAKMSLSNIMTYVSNMEASKGTIRILMKNKQYIENDGPRLQVALFRDLMDIITKTNDAEFRYAMDFLMQLFVLKGDEGQPLNYINLMRFQENLKLSLVDQYCYPNLMRMLTALADPLTRVKNARTVINFEKALKYGFSDEAKARLISYFTR